MSLVCNAPWNCLFVWNDGTVSYCGRTEVKGNLRQQDFRSFWNSSPVVEARANFFKNNNFAVGCPPTCCLLTIRQPNTFMRYFDRHPSSGEAKAVVPIELPPAPMKVPRSQDENFAAIEKEISEERAAVSSFPTTLSLQLFNYCSLRCPMCCFGIIPPDMKKPSINIIDPIVLDRVKDVYPFITRIDLVGGELFDIPFDDNPLVRVLSDVAEVAPDTINITITTNGQHLSRRWVDYLLDFPFIDIIAFSIDSFDPEIYARTRVNGSLDRVRQSIENVRAAKAARGLTRPIIRFNSILGAHTCGSLTDFIENAKLLGAYEIEFQKLVSMGRLDFFPENNLFQPKYVDELVRVWRDLAASDFRSNGHEIMGMIAAYLDNLGHGSRVASEPGIPFNSQLRQESHVGPIYGEHHISQAFCANRDTVSRIKFVTATYDRENSEDLFVSIDGLDGPVTRATVKASAIQDNAWISVDVPRAQLEVGKEYLITIRSPTSTPDNAIAVRYSASGGAFTYGTEQCSGEIAHMLF